MNAEKTNYDLLYNPRLTVTGYEQVFERWERDSERARARLDCYLDVPYGTAQTETLDLFRAKGRSRGLLMFIHGGYWRSLDKKRFSFVAPPLVEAGVTDFRLQARVPEDRARAEEQLGPIVAAFRAAVGR